MKSETFEHPEFGAVSIENGWVPSPGYVLRRRRVTRLFPLRSSWLGTRVLRACCKLQDLFADTELGPGYFVTAPRRG